MELSNYFDSCDTIKWEEKDKADKTFAVAHKFAKKKYNLYVKHSKKNHEQFEGTSVIQKLIRY